MYSVHIRVRIFVFFRLYKFIGDTWEILCNLSKVKDKGYWQINFIDSGRFCNSCSSFKSGRFIARLFFYVQNTGRRVGGTGKKIACLHCHYDLLRLYFFFIHPHYTLIPNRYHITHVTIHFVLFLNELSLYLNQQHVQISFIIHQVLF